MFRLSRGFAGGQMIEWSREIAAAMFLVRK